MSQGGQFAETVNLQKPLTAPLLPISLPLTRLRIHFFAAVTGSGLRAIAGVSISPASHGSVEANASWANCHLCRPGVATTAQEMPFAWPSAQRVLAASVSALVSLWVRGVLKDS